jgi:hypothetical protein
MNVPNLIKIDNNSRSRPGAIHADNTTFKEAVWVGVVDVSYVPPDFCDAGEDRRGHNIEQSEAEEPHSKRLNEGYADTRGERREEGGGNHCLFESEAFSSFLSVWRPSFGGDPGCYLITKFAINVDSHSHTHTRHTRRSGLHPSPLQYLNYLSRVERRYCTHHHKTLDLKRPEYGGSLRGS